jgi:RIO kinase 1
MDERTVDRGEAIQTYLESTAYRSNGLGLTRDTRATVDQVLDPKTIEVLQKMIKQGHFDELAGCISTGKEANVYFGIKDGEPRVAVKVYKTSILGFRDRDEYVDGEFRFRHGYCKSNPRKMVSLWAEKEQRNLNRLRKASIVCPEVLCCKRNVLVMSLIGTTERAAPRLRDALDSSIDWTKIYADVAIIMRRMFRECKLVHGDLSEYNMLLEGSQVVVIDVSQSVGTDHPRSLEFLKRDCLNVNNFFIRKVPEGIIPLRQMFEFITGNQNESQLTQLMGARSTEISDSHDESVFMRTWVPSSLAEMGDMNEIERFMKNKQEGLSTVFDNLLTIDTESASEYSDSDPSDAESIESASESGSDVSDAASAFAAGFDGHKPPEMSKQEWKKKVKEEQREKRKNKVPKYIKNKRNLKKYGKK